jgi:regulatory protein
VADAPKDAYPYERAWNYALWLLGRQAYTGAQLREKLVRKGAAPETVARVLARLTELTLLDDAHYAEAYVHSRSRNKGALKLRQELLYKGVREELVEKALGTLEGSAQVEAARALLAKNLWRWRGEPRERYAKAYAFLARRGFPVDVVKAALERSPLAQDI